MQIVDYLTAILVLVTAIYSYLTYKMAKASEASVVAMREQSEAMMRPYITISPFIRPHTTLLYLRIENTGKNAAENMRLVLDKDFFQFGESKHPDRNLRTNAAFTQNILSLPPGGKLVFALGQGFLIFAPDADPNVLPQLFTITTSYSFGSKKIIEICPIDLRPYIGSEGERDPLVDELAKLREIVERRN